MNKRNPETSIVIRAKNEAKYLKILFKKLEKQTYKNFEIVIVDENSTDNTKKIVQQHKYKLVNVPKGKFTYPFSTNLGCKNSRGKYLVFLSAHSLPITDTWLEDGLSNFKDKKVAGVYAITLALQHANLIEKTLYNINAKLLHRKRKVLTKKKQARMGVLGFTNAIIRSDLWMKRNINEAFARGGDDGDWARYWLERGYKIIHDPKFRVYHSHNLGLFGLIKQQIGWIKMQKESKFIAQQNKL